MYHQTAFLWLNLTGVAFTRALFDSSEAATLSSRLAGPAEGVE
jgi:hypothetical protein